jgi:hypothetical protein
MYKQGELAMINLEANEAVLNKADAAYEEETGYTPREHFHRTSVILTTREDRNAARQRYNEIVTSLEGLA